MTKFYARKTFSVGGNPAVVVEKGSIASDEVMALLKNYPADREALLCEVGDAVGLAQETAASGMRRHMVDAAPPPGTVNTRLANLDPAALTGKSIAELNLMLEDRKIDQVDTVEEAIALLTEEFEAEAALSTEEVEAKRLEDEKALEAQREKDAEIEEAADRKRLEDLAAAANAREELLKGMNEEDRAAFLKKEEEDATAAEVAAAGGSE